MAPIPVKINKMKGITSLNIIIAEMTQLVNNLLDSVEINLQNVQTRSKENIEKKMFKFLSPDFILIIQSSPIKV